MDSSCSNGYTAALSRRRTPSTRHWANDMRFDKNKDEATGLIIEVIQYDAAKSMMWLPHAQKPNIDHTYVLMTKHVLHPKDSAIHKKFSFLHH